MSGTAPVPEDPTKPAVTIAEALTRAQTAVLEISQKLGDDALSGKVTSVVIVTSDSENFSVSFGGLGDSVRALGLLQMAAMWMLRGIPNR